MMKTFYRKRLFKRGRLWLLVAVIIALGLTGFSCIQGLQPIGWSGGVVADGTLFAGSREGKLVSINLADESRRWSEALKGTQSAGGFGCSTGSTSVAIYGTPAVIGDRVYVGGYNGKFYAFDTATLQIADVYPADGYLQPIVGGPVAADGVVYFGSSDGILYALNAESFLLEWSFPTGDKIWATPAVSEGIVFIGSFDNNFYALNAADGSEIWKYETDGAIITTPLVYNGVVYFGSFDRHLYAVNIADGSLRWESMGGNWFWAQPVVCDDTIYAPCLDGKVYALNADNGEEVATIDLDSPVSSSPVVVGGSVIVATKEGLVYGIDASLNEFKQLADVGQTVYGPLCASGDVVYIHTQDLTLHRINVITGAVLGSISLGSTD